MGAGAIFEDGMCCSVRRARGVRWKGRKGGLMHVSPNIHPQTRDVLSLGERAPAGDK